METGWISIDSGSAQKWVEDVVPEGYNASVNINNIRIDQFPDVIIARAFNFSSRELWKIDPAHRADVEIKFNHT